VTNDDLRRLVSVQQWLYAEARLLDERRYDLWRDLLADDVRYRLPARAYVAQADCKDFSTWGVDREIGGAGSLALIDDDAEGLKARIGRLQTGMAWAETPPSMTRRQVSNVQILDVSDDGTLSVVSNLFLAKSRADERVLLTAERRDRLAPVGDGYRLKDRYVVIDDVVLASSNLSTIF
jgi:3-phenylpropionate/cinnamic acid dioxygenase small subunit